MARAPAPVFDRMTFESYVFREYPKMLFSKSGGKVISRTVKTEAEEQALVGDWFSTQAEAQAVGPIVPPGPNAKVSP